MTTVPIFGLDVIRRIPHDVTAFTQGFATAGTALYESTGLYGESELRELDVTTGEVRRARPLRSDLFGEGIAVVGDTIWQLTWQERTALEWDRTTLTLRREIPMDGDGWGLCFDGTHLVQSDGTDVLRFRDPVTFTEIHTVTVALGGKPMRLLNDLTFMSGQLWANILGLRFILAIDPSTGSVTAAADAQELLTPEEHALAGPLNGITSAGPDAVIVSGKLWPFAFEVRMHERPGWRFAGLEVHRRS